jgi:hypothetical protein
MTGGRPVDEPLGLQNELLAAAGPWQFAESM